MSIADELIMRGWTQHAYVAANGAVCLESAACWAMFGHDYYVALRDERLKLEAVLLRAIGDESYRWPSTWNDADGRTFDEVLRVAKHADEILAARASLDVERT